jgi:hypothetical protein
MRVFCLITHVVLRCTASFIANRRAVLLWLWCGLLGAAVVGCDEGLKPPPPPTILSGTITYVGGRASWPPADSVLNLRLVAFKEFPPRDIFGEIIMRRAYYTPEGLTLDSTLAKFAERTAYSIEIPDPAPEELQYIAVVMLVNPQILLPSSWRVVGIHNVNGDNTRPARLRVTPNAENRADIRVDFRNLPPQPFN